ncbi:DUF1697 domain-containing protein [Sphingomonas sp. dw_22]|uniref:DUF1697 domain-containing protein n=1 Tax=Sphingomonas sp. dw_22 TaxID=2721175 RepID=UPI001BD388D2
MKRWAGLLKGVNVGGRKLPMAELKALAEGLGFEDVRTLLASGNVVFSAKGDAAAIEQALEAALETHGLKTDVVVRDLAELSAILAANPFPDAAQGHPNHLLVHFHRDPVPGEPIARLPELHDGPERLHAIGRELYVDYPDDVGHSKLPQSMAKAKFPRLATARNWNTVNKLVAMLAGE